MNLFDLIIAGDLEAIKDNLKYEEINKLRDIKGRSLLFVAIINDKEEIAKYLLTQGLDPNIIDHSGESCLFDCVRKNKLAMAKLLISKGASIDILNRKGESVLYYICYNGHIDILKKIRLEDIERFTTNEGLNLMHAAILGGHIEVVNYLLKYYKDLFLVDKMGNSYLHYAAKSGVSEIAKIFIDKKLDINFFNHSFETPLFNAVKLGDLKMTKFLVNQGAYAVLKNKHFATPLDIARINDLDNISSFFEDYLNNPKVIQTLDDEQLIIAVLNRNYWDLRQILERTIDLDHKNKFGLTALDYAKKYKLQLVIELIQKARKYGGKTN